MLVKNRSAQLEEKEITITRSVFEQGPQFFILQKKYPICSRTGRGGLASSVEILDSHCELFTTLTLPGFQLHCLRTESPLIGRYVLCGPDLILFWHMNMCESGSRGWFHISGGSRISHRGRGPRRRGVYSRGSYISKILYVEM